MRRRLSLIAFLLSAFAVSFAGDDDYVRWSLEAPGPSPWVTIRYEITRRTPATTAVHRRRLPGTEEGEHALGLLTPEESDAFFDSVRALTPLTLASDPPPKGKAAAARLRFRCDLLLDGTLHTFTATDPATHANPAIRALFHSVADLVTEIAGPLPFRQVFFPATERAWLNVESVPAAVVSVDGFDTGLTAPLYAYEVKAGERVVTLRTADGALERTYTVRVEPGGTTTLRVDLR